MLELSTDEQVGTLPLERAEVFQFSHLRLRMSVASNSGYLLNVFIDMGVYQTNYLHRKDSVPTFNSRPMPYTTSIPFDE